VKEDEVRVRLVWEGGCGRRRGWEERVRGSLCLGGDAREVGGEERDYGGNNGNTKEP